MRPLLAMIKANLKMSYRNRQALFWNLAFPAIFIIIFGAVFSRGENILFQVGVADDGSSFQSSVTAVLDADDAFVLSIGEEASERQKLSDGERDFVIVFGPPAAGTSIPTVTIFYDESNGPNAAIGLNVLRQVLMSVAQSENPVPIAVQPISAERLSFIDFFVPGILAMALMNSGVIGLSTAFVIYRERGILRRIKVTPFPLTSFILARVVSQLIVAVAQAVILVGMAIALFGLDLQGNPAVMFLVILVGALTFLAVGFAISGVSKNAETAASYANLVTFPMLFLSGVFFSLDAAPEWLLPITKVLPLKYLVHALRETMTRGNGLDAVWLDLAVLGATFVVSMVVAVRFFRWDARGA